MFLNCLFSFSAYALDGVNLRGYFAYAFNDQHDPGFGMYGHMDAENIMKSSLTHYSKIIDNNGFPVPGSSPQHCPHITEHSPVCHVLAKHTVVGFISLVASAMLVTVGVVIYYCMKRPK